VLTLDERVEAPIGWFTKVLMTKDFTPSALTCSGTRSTLEVRPVVALGVSGGIGREELVKLSYR
jgi:hypothetical protein